jgi:outer membrane immunogenic protein
MKRLLGIALFALASSSAFAADLPARMPAKAPAVMQPMYNWSGVYVGINGGYGFGRSSWTDVATGASTGNFNVNGGLIGGTLGVNWQTNALVFGIETDIDWTNIKGSTALAGCGAAGCETKNSFLGTLRGRVGYAIDRFMPYITGGLAYGDMKISDGTGSASTTRAGWALGGGVEWAVVGPWTAKLEYIYADLGKATCGAPTCNPTDPFDVKFNTSIVRAGLNYRF